MGDRDVAKGGLLPHLSVALPLPLLQPADDTQWHSKLSGYLYCNTSCLKPNNEHSWREDCLNTNSVIKWNILGDSWINHLLWISLLSLLIRGKQVAWKVPKQWRVGHVQSKVYVKLVCCLIGAGGCVFCWAVFHHVEQRLSRRTLPSTGQHRKHKELWRVSALTVCKSLTSAINNHFQHVINQLSIFNM